MSAGRDDFVIAIRSAFLKRENKQKFSLSGLLLFSIFLILLSKFNIKAVDYLRLGINEGVYRLSFIASIPEQEIKKTSTLIQNHFNLLISPSAAHQFVGARLLAWLPCSMF